MAPKTTANLAIHTRRQIFYHLQITLPCQGVRCVLDFMFYIIIENARYSVVLFPSTEGFLPTNND